MVQVHTVNSSAVIVTGEGADSKSVTPNKHGEITVNGKILSLGKPFAELPLQIDFEFKEGAWKETARRLISKETGITIGTFYPNGEATSDLEISELIGELKAIHIAKTVTADAAKVGLSVDGKEYKGIAGLGNLRSHPYDRLLIDKLKEKNYEVLVEPLPPEAQTTRRILFLETEIFLNTKIQKHYPCNVMFKQGEDLPYACKVNLVSPGNDDLLQAGQVMLYYDRSPTGAKSSKISKVKADISLSQAAELYLNSIKGHDFPEEQTIIVETKQLSFSMPHSRNAANLNRSIEHEILIRKLTEESEYSIVFAAPVSEPHPGEGNSHAAAIKKTFWGPEIQITRLIKSDLIRLTFTKGELTLNHYPSQVEFLNGKLSEVDSAEHLVKCNYLPSAGRSARKGGLDKSSAVSFAGVEELLEIISEDLSNRVNDKSSCNIVLGDAEAKTHYRLPGNISDWEISDLLSRMLREKEKYQITGQVPDKKNINFGFLGLDPIYVPAAAQIPNASFEISVSNNHYSVKFFYGEGVLTNINDRPLNPPPEQKIKPHSFLLNKRNPGGLWQSIDHSDAVNQVFLSLKEVQKLRADSCGTRVFPLGMVGSGVKLSANPKEQLSRLWMFSRNAAMQAAYVNEYEATRDAMSESLMMGMLFRALINGQLFEGTASRILTIGSPLCSLSHILTKQKSAVESQSIVLPEITDVLFNEAFIRLSDAADKILLDSYLLDPRLITNECDLVICTGLHRMKNQEKVIDAILQGIPEGGRAVIVLDNYKATNEFQTLLIERGFVVNHLNKRFEFDETLQLAPDKLASAREAISENYLLAITKRTEVPAADYPVLSSNLLIAPVSIKDDLSRFSELIREISDKKRDSQVITNACEVFELLEVLSNNPLAKLNHAVLAEIINKFAGVGLPEQDSYRLKEVSKEELVKVMSKVHSDLRSIGVDPEEIGVKDIIDKRETVILYHCLAYQLMNWVLKDLNKAGPVEIEL